jgi:hypothetical protein
MNCRGMDKEPNSGAEDAQVLNTNTNIEYLSNNNPYAQNKPTHEQRCAKSKVDGEKGGFVSPLAALALLGSTKAWRRAISLLNLTSLNAAFSSTARCCFHDPSHHRETPRWTGLRGRLSTNRKAFRLARCPTCCPPASSELFWKFSAPDHEIVSTTGGGFDSAISHSYPRGRQCIAAIPTIETPPCW